jgi:gluconokinase
MVVLVMGVAGSGKTTIGTELARRLGWVFADADDYHPAANREKMSHGIPLTDEDRAPWLATLHQLIVDWISGGVSAVLACSALKRAYRDELGVRPEVRILYLKADPEVLRMRLHNREGHYMKEGMLASQLATLEEPDDAVVVDVNGTVSQSVQQALAKLGLADKAVVA